MKPSKLIHIVLVLAFLTSTFPQPPPPAEQAKVTAAENNPNLVSLELKNIDVVEVIKIISRKGKINVVISNNVRGRITMFLNDVSLNDALMAVLESANLAFVEEKNIMKIMPASEYEAAFGKPFYDNRTLTVIPVTNASASDMAASLSKLKPKAVIIVDERTNTLLIRDTAENIEELKKAASEMDRKIITENYKVKNLSQKQTEDLIKMMISKKGTYYFDTKIAQVVIQDYPENVEKILTLLKAHDIPTRILTKIYELDYAKFDVLEAKLKTLLTPEIGSILSDERTNKILVSDLEPNFERIDKMVSAYDRKDREVLIEAKIVQVLLNDNFQWGINWQTIIKKINNMGLKITDAYDFSGDIAKGTGFAESIDKNTAVSSSSTPDVDTTTTTTLTAIDALGKSTTTSNSTRTQTTTNAQIAPAEGVSPFNTGISYPGGARIVAVGSIDGNQFEGVLNALKLVGDTKVLSSPRIITVSNETAKIHVVSKQAYATSTVVTPGTGPATTSENVTFIDVGITLEVTPIINKEKFITMKVKPAVSSVTSTVTTASGNKIPIVSTQEIESKIQVLDGTTIVLGGLHEQTSDKQQNRFPFLGAIPILGWLFKKINNTMRNSELVMFLTPHIMTGERSFYEPEQPPMVSDNVMDFLKEGKLYEKARQFETVKDKEEK